MSQHREEPEEEAWAALEGRTARLKQELADADAQQAPSDVPPNTPSKETKREEIRKKLEEFEEKRRALHAKIRAHKEPEAPSPQESSEEAKHDTQQSGKEKLSDIYATAEMKAVKPKGESKEKKTTDRAVAGTEKKSKSRLDDQMAELLKDAPKPKKRAPDQNKSLSDSGATVLDDQMLELLRKSKAEAATAPPKPKNRYYPPLVADPEVLLETFEALVKTNPEQVALLTYEDDYVLRQAQGLDGPSLKLLRPFFDRVRETGKAELILDSGRESKLKELSQVFRCGFCVPVKVDDRVVALLYSGTTSAGRLGYGELKEAEGLAAGLAGEFKPPVRQSGDSADAELTEKANFKLLAGPVALLLCALLWFVFAPRPPVESGPSATRTPTVRAAEELGPLPVAESFLHLVRLRQPGAAWDLLSPELQAKIPRERFVTQIQAWLGDDVNKWELDYRKPVIVEEYESVAVLHINPGENAGERPLWKWTIQQTELGWKIDKMSGAPMVTD